MLWQRATASLAKVFVTAAQIPIHCPIRLCAQLHDLARVHAKCSPRLIAEALTASIQIHASVVGLLIGGTA